MSTFNKKKSSRFILIKSVVLILAISLLSLEGCKKDDPLTSQETVSALLTSAAWLNPEVTVDGVDYSDLYKDFSISFDKTSYTTQSGAPVWAPSGTWVFANKEATLLKLDGITEVEINSISNEALELSLFWNQDTFEPGRTKSVKGKNKFKLKRKR